MSIIQLMRAQAQLGHSRIALVQSLLIQHRALVDTVVRLQRQLDETGPNIQNHNLRTLIIRCTERLDRNTRALREEDPQGLVIHMMEN